MKKMISTLLFLCVPLAATAQEDDYKKLRSEVAVMFDRPLQEALEVLIDILEEYESPAASDSSPGCDQELKIFRAARSAFFYIERYELIHGFEPDNPQENIRSLVRELFEVAIYKLDWINQEQAPRICEASNDGIHAWYVQIESNVPIAPALVV